MKFILEQTRIQAGNWEGILTGADGETAPTLSVYWGDQKLSDPTLIQEEGGAWHVQVSIPTEAINGGVQTFYIRDPESEVLTTFKLTAGQAQNDGLDAEVRLLRAELDMLKRAFRREFHE